jgi:hypothetical protein
MATNNYPLTKQAITSINACDSFVDNSMTISEDKLNLDKDSIIKFLKPKHTTKMDLKKLLKRGYEIETAFDQIFEVFVNGVLLERDIDYIINKKYIVFKTRLTEGDSINIKGSVRFVVKEGK